MDCSSGAESCFPNVSCEFMASEAIGLGVYNDEDNVVGTADTTNDEVEPSFSNDGSNSSSSSSSSSSSGSIFGIVCGVKGALVSVGVSSAVMMWVMM